MFSVIGDHGMTFSGDHGGKNLVFVDVNSLTLCVA